jgi:hypothetical protein
MVGNPTMYNDIREEIWEEKRRMPFLVNDIIALHIVLGIGGCLLGFYPD